VIFSSGWWEEKKKFIGGYWGYLVNSFKDGSFKDDFINAVEEIGGWFEETLPNWSAFWEEVGYKIYDVTEMRRNAIDKIIDKTKEFAEEWNSAFQGVGEKVYDLSHNKDGSSKGLGGVGGMIPSSEWWEEKKKLFGDYWDYLKQSINDGTLKEDFLRTWGEVDKWFHDTFPEWHEFWEGLGEKAIDIVDKIKNKFQELSDASENSAWFKHFSNAGSNLYDLMHDDDDNEAETFSYTSPVTGKTYNNVLKFNSDGTETELYKKYGSRHAAGGFPNKGSLFLAGEAGAELIGNFGTSQTKVINQSQITNNTQQPVMFQPTILIDGRKITATVVDNINTMTRSSGNSPLIQLG